MGVDIAVGARAGDFRLEAPDEGKIRVGDPVLGVAGAVMKDAVADCALVDHAFGEGDGGNAAVVVADHVDDVHPRVEHLHS